MAEIIHGECLLCQAAVPEGVDFCERCNGQPSAVPVSFPFPTWVFPSAVQEYVETFSKAGPFPLSMVGTAILPVAAAAIGERRNLLVSQDTDWVEPSIVWAALCGLSGCGKSPILDEIMKPLVKLDTDAHLMYEREREDWRRARGKEKEDISKGQPPFKRAWIRTDATIEALGTDLSRKRDILCFYDELVQWVGQLNGYGPKQMDTNRAKWLQLHTGKRMDRRRIGQNGDEVEILIPNPRVSILGGIQPAVVHKLRGNDDDGMTYRFLFAYGEKMSRDNRSGATQNREEWEKFIRWAARLTPGTVPLQRDAFLLIDDFDDVLVAEGTSDEVAAKMKTYAARLALVLAHMWMFAEGVTLREVTAEDVERAQALCRFFVDQRERFIEDHFVPDNDGRITVSTVDAVYKYIVRRCRAQGSWRIHQRTIIRGKPAGVIRTSALEQILGVLQEDGRINWFKEGREKIVEVLNV